MVGSHTDSPGFRVKNQYAENDSRKFLMLRLNTEVYGGPYIKSYVFDIPLTIAGRVSFKKVKQYSLPQNNLC